MRRDTEGGNSTRSSPARILRLQRQATRHRSRCEAIGRCPSSPTRCRRLCRSADPLDQLLLFEDFETRRHFLKKIAGTSLAVTLGPHVIALASAPTTGGDGSSRCGEGDWRSTQNKRTGLQSAARSAHFAARFVARTSAPDRFEKRLRPRAMRRLHGAGQRPPDQFTA